jgi:hypothetical protein
MVIFVFLVLMLTMHSTHARNMGDSLNVQAFYADGSTVEFPGVTLCVDNVVELKRQVTKLVFEESGVVTEAFTNPSVELLLEAHEGRILRTSVRALQSANENPVLKVKWLSCTFERDEILPLQLLFGIGSVLSIALFILIILDSRSKRIDNKFY